MLTLNEVFCRNDYPADSSLRVVLDVGSNIGISALYFLTRNRHSRCYLFEPSPNNVHRLRRQLAPFEGRYELAECAVADRDGEVTFGVEPTGRYGGIDVETGQSITVACRHINGVLAEILEKEGSIDIIKIDTEGAEISTVKAMDARLLESVRSIFLEAAPDESLREGMFGQRHCVSIAQLRNLKAVRPYAGEAKRQAMASSMR
jgi:FkbM family methyltransferase